MSDITVAGAKWTKDMGVAITEDNVVSVERTLATTKVGDETIIFDDESGTYVSLTEVGTVIFDRLKEPQSVSALIDHLMATYDVDRETCRKDVLSFLDDMRQAKIISLA